MLPIKFDFHSNTSERLSDLVDAHLITFLALCFVKLVLCCFSNIKNSQLAFNKSKQILIVNVII